MAIYQTDISKAIEILAEEDGVVVVPTDTHYKLLCRLDRPRAIERLFELNQRDRTRSLVILGGDQDSLMGWITDDLTVPIIVSRKFWPGAVTLIARASDRVPAGILGPGFQFELSVGLRMPNHEVALELLRQLPDHCAASASLETKSTSLEDVRRTLGSTVDYVVGDGEGRPRFEHSTVVDLTSEQPCIVREGAVDGQTILDCVNDCQRR